MLLHSSFLYNFLNSGKEEVNDTKTERHESSICRFVLNIDFRLSLVKINKNNQSQVHFVQNVQKAVQYLLA